MDISLISLVEVPFAYGKALRLNMTNVSSGSNFFPLNVMTRTDASEGQLTAFIVMAITSRKWMPLARMSLNGLFLTRKQRQNMPWAKKLSKHEW